MKKLIIAIIILVSIVSCNKNVMTPYSFTHLPPEKINSTIRLLLDKKWKLSSILFYGNDIDLNYDSVAAVYQTVSLFDFKQCYLNNIRYNYYLNDKFDTIHIGNMTLTIDSISLSKLEMTRNDSNKSFHLIYH